MRKTACFVFSLALLGILMWSPGKVFAQEGADPRAAAMAAEGILPPQVTTSMGKITLHGMVLTGVQGYMADNTALDKDVSRDEEWMLQGWNPTWQENVARVSLIYDNGKYGGYVMFSAEDWQGNIETGFEKVDIPYAFIWRSFFDNKLKVTMGKLYAEDYQTRDRIWRAEGASEGGWEFSDSRDYAAARIEFKPIIGLNVGAQWNFLPLGQERTGQGLPNLAESLKEVSLAAEYKSDLFNILAGIRFDGDDGMNKHDVHTYLKDYYGEWGYVGGQLQDMHTMSGYGLNVPYDNLTPHWKHYDEVYGTVIPAADRFDRFTLANYDKPFDGSARAIFGFNYKGVKNLTAKMQASIWNLGDFERFGSASFDETIGYNITPKFNASINLYQDFYGSDAFPDDMVNSPYFRFEPIVSYQLTNLIKASLLFTGGIAKDVIESDWRIKPALSFVLGGFGSLSADLFYELKAITYTEKAASSAKANFIPRMMQVDGGKAIYKHTLGLGVSWMF
jgi:hypothetical protein